MELSKLIASRRTVHTFSTQTVDDTLVKTALELSLWAPNHKLTFPWRYLALGAQVRERLGELNVELKGGAAALSAVKARAAKENVTTPSHLIALGLRRSDSESTDHENYATLACSVQIASLYLWEKGVATKWSTGEWGRHPKTYEILGLDSKAVKLEGCLMIGYAAVMPAASARPALLEVLQIVP